jgi:FixJ family two-component response regulator
MPGDPNTYVAIVDDDESVCRSLGRLLSVSGFLPVTFFSAEDFLDDRKRPHFDCLILDVQLDGISGIELARRLVAVNDHTPFIFITAYDDPAAQAEAIALGCAGYFRKHDAGNSIIQTIREAVCGKHSTTA